MGITSMGIMSGCNSAATTTTTNGSVSPESLQTYDPMSQLAQGNRGETPNAKAPTTPEEYIKKSGDGLAMKAAMVGTVPPLKITPQDFMLNRPVWLGEAPEITDIAYEEKCDVLVLGSGQSGTTAALRCAELGLDTLCLEVQTWDEYDNYACDMALYNSKVFIDKGGEEYRFDTKEIFNEYMRRAIGHCHPELIRSYAERSSEMADWMFEFIPQNYRDKYLHTTNCPSPRKAFNGESCKQLSFPAMFQWRDNDTNLNMWPFVVRSLMTAMEKQGGRHIYGAQGIRLVQNDAGTVVGCIASDIDGKHFRVNCKAVMVATGGFGGNPDMRLDLSDQLRNLAWSWGKDRTDTGSTGGMGRDGSGIKMCLWAGATMEAGPRASMGGSINGKPEFALGGCWPVFGPDGKRFFNESQLKFGAVPVIDMIPAGSLLVTVTDANWEEKYEGQGYGHEAMDRSNPIMVEEVRKNMANYVTGKDGFPVRAFARYGNESITMYAAETLEELGQIMGYEGEALKGFLDEIKHWNEMCQTKKDTDWGCDPQMMYPIDKAPFFGSYSITKAGTPGGGLVQLAGVNTDGKFRVLDAAKSPIKGLYAIGNACGNRYAVQYHTPTSGNSCGMALTNGYVAAEYVAADLKNN